MEKPNFDMLGDNMEMESLTRKKARENGDPDIDNIYSLRERLVEDIMEIPVGSLPIDEETANMVASRLLGDGLTEDKKIKLREAVLNDMKTNHENLIKEIENYIKKDS